MTRSKFPSIEKSLHEGQLVDGAWLRNQGFNRPRIDAFLRSQKLESVSHGLYRRPGPPLKWELVVYSLNVMGCPIHAGGRTALELQGLAHYLPLSGVKQIDLYGAFRVPAWLEKLPEEFTFKFRVHRRLLFDNDKLPKAAVTTKPFGTWDFPVPYATPELALLELLAGVRDETDFELADKFFESATTLRPVLLRDLLKVCESIKAKRLFFWFGARHGQSWFNALDRNDANLGEGKRQLVKGGMLDKDYQITVPKDMAIGHQQFRY